MFESRILVYYILNMPYVGLLAQLSNWSNYMVKRSPMDNKV